MPALLRKDCWKHRNSNPMLPEYLIATLDDDSDDDFDDSDYDNNNNNNNNNNRL